MSASCVSHQPKSVSSRAARRRLEHRTAPQVRALWLHVLVVLACAVCLEHHVCDAFVGPQVTPSKEPLTPVAQLRELLFIRDLSAFSKTPTGIQRVEKHKNAHCRGGSARHHTAFYPNRVRCQKVNHATTLDTANWECQADGPYSVLTYVRDPLVRCTVSNRRVEPWEAEVFKDVDISTTASDSPDTAGIANGKKKKSKPKLPELETIDTSSCSLSYKLDFRTSTIVAIALLTFTAAFTFFALAAHLILTNPVATAVAFGIPPSRASHVGTNDSWVLKSQTLIGYITTWCGNTQSTYSAATTSAQASDRRTSNGAESLNRSFAAHADPESGVPFEENLPLLSSQPNAQATSDGPNLPGYGSYARILIRNLSEGSLAFSSEPPSPPCTPPLSPRHPRDPPSVHAQTEAELLTELF